MADYSTRKRILLALVERLQQITQIRGFHTDAGEHVQLGRRSTSEEDTRPRIALIPGAIEPLEKTLDGDEIRRWAMTVHGLIDDETPEALLVIEDLLADIKRALFQPDDVGLGGLALEVETQGGEITAEPDTGSHTASCTLPFAIRYTEAYGQP